MTSARRRTIRALPQGLGEDALGAWHAQTLHLERNVRARPHGLLWRRARIALSVVAAVYLFTLGLQLLSAGAGEVASGFDRLRLQGATNLIGAAWLAAYGALSGSPVAALSLSLLDGGAIDRAGALAMIAGSRLGASMIVLLVALVAWLRGQRGPDAIFVGVVAMLVTFALYLPALVIAAPLAGSGAVEGVAGAVPSGVAGAGESIVAPLTRPLAETLPGAGLLALGAGLLLGAFWLFDRLLPTLETPGAGFEVAARATRSPRVTFLIGAGVTALTMSAGLSIALLVPLTLRGIVRRRDLVPYILGANVTTLIDTLFAAVLLDSTAAIGVVLALGLAVGVPAVALATVLERPFAAAILWLATRLTASPRGVLSFLSAIAMAPVILIAV
jgi:Na+/phosphate symporter